MKRSAPIKRKTPLRRVNRKRRAKAFARNYGDRGQAIREMPCLVHGYACWSVAAHVQARGMGGRKGDRRSLVPLCQTLHSELDDRLGVDAFDHKYQTDLRREASRIASLLDDMGYA